MCLPHKYTPSTFADPKDSEITDLEPPKSSLRTSNNDSIEATDPIPIAESEEPGAAKATDSKFDGSNTVAIEVNKKEHAKSAVEYKSLIETKL